MRAALVLIAWISCLPVFSPAVAADEPTTGGSLKVTADKIDRQAGKIQFTLPPPIGQRAIPVDDASAKQRLGEAQDGDILQIEVDQIDNPQHIKRLVTISRPVAWYWRIAALVVGFAIVFFAAMLCKQVKPVDFLVGVDKRYSNSKFQAAIWFSALMSTYLATLILRVWTWGPDFLYGVEITPNLLALSGLSALTFGGAKAITSQKVDNAAKDALAQEAEAADLAAKANTAPEFKPAAAAAKKGAKAAEKTAKMKQAATSSFPCDLFQNDKHEADLGDFQMIFIAVIAVVTFLLKVEISFLAAIEQLKTVPLPDVDTTLLSVFGVGQGAYLIKKMASKPGDG